MASVKVVLRSKVNKDGTYPLILQVIKDRKKAITHLGYHVKKSDWDANKQQVKRSHPNSARLNNFIMTKLAEAQNKVLEVETQKGHASAQALKQSIRPSGTGLFFGQAAIYLNNLWQQGKYNQYSADKPRIERFREFLNGSDIAFSDINPTLLKKFKAYLKGTRNISDRTAINHLVVIRTVFNQAIAAHVADKRHYPFGKGNIVIKFPDSLKIGLTPEEVKTLEDLDLSATSSLHHARNLWLTSFYFAGMRISDIYRLAWTDFQNDRLYYAMGKNAKGGSLKVPDKVLKILVQYKRDNPTHNLVFPDLETIKDMNDKIDVQKKIKWRLKALNKNLQKVAELANINKPLTMHIGRHTFGNISGDKIPIQMLQKLYRHSSITTTIGYQANFIHKDADEALDAVISF